MSIELVTWNGHLVTPQDDALIYETAINVSGIFYGVEVTLKNSNTLHVTGGHGIIAGRKFTVEEEDISIVLPQAEMNGRLYIHMDLSNTAAPMQFMTEVASTLTEPIRDDDVNIINGVYELNLATFTAGVSTISNVVNVRETAATTDIIAPTENGAVLSKDYHVGEMFQRKGKLYQLFKEKTAGTDAESAIASGCWEVKISTDLYKLSGAAKADSTTLYSVIDALFPINNTDADLFTRRVNRDIANGEYFVAFASYMVQYPPGAVREQKIYRATANIPNGAQYTVGTNCVEVTMMEAINILNDATKASINDILELFASKVSKSGDTMTGKLIIDYQNGTTSSIGVSDLELGNIKQEGEQGNSRGRIKLYGTQRNAAVNLYAGSDVTTIRQIIFPNKDGTVALLSNVEDRVSKSGDTMTGALTVNLQNGTASTVGTSSVIVGNNISQGVAQNSRGMIRIYGTNQNYVNLLVGDLTAYRNIAFPDKAGTVAVYTGVTITGKNSFTVGNVSARVIGDLLIARFTLNCRTSAWTAGIVAASLNVTAAVAGSVPPENGTSAPWLEIAANSSDLKAAAGTAGASAWYTLILVVK